MLSIWPSSAAVRVFSWSCCGLRDPGMVLASMFRPESITEHLVDVMVGMLSAAAIASANYVLNE